MANITYTHNNVDGVYQILRNDIHIANYDPVTEETTFTADEYKKYFGPISKEIIEINGGTQHSNPPTGDPAGPDGLSHGPDTQMPNDEVGETAGLDNVEVEDEDNDPVVPPDFNDSTDNGPVDPGEDFTPPTMDVVDGKPRTALTQRVAVILYEGVWTEDKFADADEANRNLFLDIAEKVLAEVGNPASLKAEILRINSQLNATSLALSEANDQIARGGTGFNYGNVSRVAERYADPVDLTGAPEQDPALGDMTPAFIEWARTNFTADVFTRRYRGRVAGV